MEKQNKIFIITMIIFIITAVTALFLVLNKGKIFGYSLVNIESEEIEYVLELSTDKETLSVTEQEETVIKVLLDGEETSENIELISSNEEIIFVENGIAKAVGVGTATITAKYETADAEIELTGIMPIENITFTSTSSSVRIGNQLQLKLQISPSDASIDTISYISSDEEIATVNRNGIVTGVSKGIVTITVQDSYTGIQKSIKLTIR